MQQNSPINTSNNMISQDLENGPIKQQHRQCRDLFCYILFIINIIWMIAFTSYGYTHGDPTQVFRPTAINWLSYRRYLFCGQANTREANYPYLYLANPYFPYDYSYCVRQCPDFQQGKYTDANYRTIETSIGNFHAQYRLDSNQPYFQPYGGNWLYDSYLIFDRVCIPNQEKYSQLNYPIIRRHYQLVKPGLFASFVLDLTKNWNLIFSSFAFSSLASLLFVITLMCLPTISLGIFAFGVILCFTSIGVLFLFNGGIIHGFQHYIGLFLQPIQSNTQQPQYNTYGYISFAISGLSLLIVILMFVYNKFNRIKIAIQMSRQLLSNFLKILTILLFLSLILICSLYASVISIIIYMVSLSDHIFDNSKIFQNYEENESSYLLIYLYIGSTIWCCFIVIDAVYFIVSSLCADWYYSEKTDKMEQVSILKGIKLLFRYHLGSVAFGSLLIVITQFLQLLLFTFEITKIEEKQMNKCSKCLCNCKNCALNCLEIIVQFINTTAYCNIILKGKNFCEAGKDGFDMKYSKMVIDGKCQPELGLSISTIFTLFIALLTTNIFYCVILLVPSIKVNVIQPKYLLIIVFIISATVAKTFISIYSATIDTLTTCFFYDKYYTHNGGKMKFATEEMKKFMKQIYPKLELEEKGIEEVTKNNLMAE